MGDTPAADPTMTPGGFINTYGNYIIQHQDVYDLLRFVWAGVLCPTTSDAMMKRMGISNVKFEDSVIALINDLVAEYALVSIISL